MISTVAEFIKQVTPGTVFYTTWTECGKPGGVEGPYTMREYCYPPVTSFPLNHTENYPWCVVDECIYYPVSVHDMLNNRSERVFLSEMEAVNFFKKERAEYATDPRWIASYLLEKERATEDRDVGHPEGYYYTD